MLRELDQNARGGRRMEEGDVFAFGSQARCLVDELDACVPAALERSAKVVHGETDVMDSGAALGDELANRGFGTFSLEKLHEGFAGAEAGDPGAVGIVQRYR